MITSTVHPSRPTVRTCVGHLVGAQAEQPLLHEDGGAEVQQLQLQLGREADVPGMQICSRMYSE